MNRDARKQSLIRKIAFLAVLVIVAIFVGLSSVRSIGPGIDNAEIEKEPERKVKFLVLTAEDHVLGSREADIFLVEYADVNCPYCRQLHSKMKELVKNQTGEVKISWVYRHFPLANLIEKAGLEERALECAAAQGGDPVFFKYLEKIIATAVKKENIITEQLMEIAKEVNLNKNLFADCLVSTTYDRRISHDRQVGLIVGVSTVPHTFLLTRTGVLEEIVGNKPLGVYEGIIKIFENSLSTGE